MLEYLTQAKNAGWIKEKKIYIYISHVTWETLQFHLPNIKYTLCAA